MVKKNSDINLDEYSAPTKQMAMKWLREIYNYHIEVRYSFLGECENGFITKIIKIGIDDIGVFLSHDSLFSCYEEAVEEGIKYCLKYLV